MEESCKAKVLDALSFITEKDITKDSSRYKDENGLVCFNGLIVELCKGEKIVTPENTDDYYNRVAGIVSDKVSEVFFGEGASFLEKDAEFDDYRTENDLYAEDIIEDEIAKAKFPQQVINGIHSDYCNQKISFKVAVDKIRNVIQLQ